MAYASFDDIRSSSELRRVQDADDGTLTKWGGKAKVEIDQFCSRDFTFEPQVAKQFIVTSQIIPVGKEISNITSATVFDTATSMDEGPINVAAELVIMPPTMRQLRYRRMINISQPYPIVQKLVTITADWGLTYVPPEVHGVFLDLIERIAARSNEDDVLQGHAAYLREDDGDGYTYDRGNGTLRNLMRSDDRAKLWKWVNHGRIVA